MANLVSVLSLLWFVRGSVAGERIVSPSSAGVTFSHSNHDPKYKVEMHSVDAPFHADLGQESMTMTDRDGLRFECFLEKTDENKDAKDVSEQYSSRVTLAKERQTKTKTPDELLEVLKDQCFLRHEGWWSYEFCYQGNVRQIHIEDKKLMQQFVLGVYDEEATAALRESSSDVSVQKDPRSKSAAQRYHAHVYTNGTICDLTNEPRETEVRFMCSGSNRALIHSIKEVSTCKYALIVQCPMLCKHPLFQEERPTWYTINCNTLANSNKEEKGDDRGIGQGGLYRFDNSTTVNFNAQMEGDSIQNVMEDTIPHKLVDYVLVNLHALIVKGISTIKNVWDDEITQSNTQIAV